MESFRIAYKTYYFTDQKDCKNPPLFSKNNEHGHIPKSPTLFDNTAYNEWQWHAEKTFLIKELCTHAQVAQKVYFGQSSVFSEKN